MNVYDLTPESFMAIVRQRMNNTDERYGQAAFNAMYLYAPQVADRFRGGELDPFYDNSKADIFVKTCFLMMMLNKEE